MENKKLIIGGESLSLHGCCTIRLQSLATYFNQYQAFPDEIDTTTQLRKYKINKEDDLDSLLFHNYKEINVALPNKPVDPIVNWMHKVYFKKVPFSELIPFVKKYFEPSHLVKTMQFEFEQKHSIDYSNTAAVFYRGLDKHREVAIGSYSTFIDRAYSILEKNPKIKFLLQTDETQFKSAFLNRFSDITFFNENLPTKDFNPNAPLKRSGVHFGIPNDLRHSTALHVLMMSKVMSECKWLITPTSHMSFWIVLYRGNVLNTYQMRHHEWWSKEN